MDFIRGASRNQVILFPESVEDYITEDNPVRFIDAFAANLDLGELGFRRA
jgi:transposase